MGQGHARAPGGANDNAAYAWQIPTATVPPGLYRVEVVFDGVPVWRTFIKITG
jgi:hypothetical protein